MFSPTLSESVVCNKPLNFQCWHQSFENWLDIQVVIYLNTQFLTVHTKLSPNKFLDDHIFIQNCKWECVVALHATWIIKNRSQILMRFCSETNKFTFCHVCIENICFQYPTCICYGYSLTKVEPTFTCMMSLFQWRNGIDKKYLYVVDFYSKIFI